MNPYLRKGLKRIPLHAFAYAGFTGTAAYLWWSAGWHHYLLIPGVLGVLAAFGKELVEQFTVNQVWVEFWVDSFSQSAGAGLGVLAVWFQSH